MPSEERPQLDWATHNVQIQHKAYSQGPSSATARSLSTAQVRVRSCSRMSLISGGPHTGGRRIALAHVSSVLCICVISGPAEVIYFGPQRSPDNGIRWAVRLCFGLGRELVGTGSFGGRPRTSCRSLDWSSCRRSYGGASLGDGVATEGVAGTVLRSAEVPPARH